MVQQYWKGIGAYGTVGLEFALSILFGGWVGYKLDQFAGLYPWLTIVFGLCGLAAGIRALWRVLKRANREAESASQTSEEARKEYHDGPPRR